MNEIASVCIPKGFVANGLHCGIKKSCKNDLALIYSRVPAKVACVFTANAVKAAHIHIDKKYLKQSNTCQAIIVNSGNANCANGKTGLKDAEDLCGSLSKIIGTKKSQVLIASTGIIGKKLAVEKIKKSLLPLVMGLNRYHAKEAALGIMTTDTHPKEVSASFKFGKSVVNIGGIAKGAGMIHPNMATMLSFITTDVKINAGLLKKALKKAVDNSFNLISVDGCMSTNDTVIILANGLSNNKVINSENSIEFKLFFKKLQEVCLKLAKMIVSDAEGATKFITIKAKGAKNDKQAKEVAFSIATSTLFKAAAFGSNPNWGRVIAAAGSALSDLKENSISIKLNKATVFKKGKPVNFSKNVLKKKEIEVLLDLGLGKSEAEIYTADLSSKYIEINARYD